MVESAVLGRLQKSEGVTMARSKELVNGNWVWYDGRHWRVESADGSWDGYELYDTHAEAVEAAEEVK